MSDGLGILDQQRERRARRIPAAKNPPRTKPVTLPQAAPDDLAPEPEPTKLPTPAATKTVIEPTVKMSIYLEPDDDLYLEGIVHAGKISRPRVAISRSAIVRLALEKLATVMTVDEIVTELRERGTQHQGTGRKRR